MGEGVVLTSTGSPDCAAASGHHTFEAPRRLASAVPWLRPSPRLRTTAPATVEAIVTDDPASRTLRVHLLGYSAPPQTRPVRGRPCVLPALTEDAPIFRAASSSARRRKPSRP